MRSRIAAVLASTLLCLLVLVAPAHAAFPGGNGKIEFSRCCDYHIRTMNPDGTGQSELPVSRIGLSPAWSPNGSRIAFVNPLSPTGQELIYTMKADGSDLRPVTPGTSYDLAISDTEPAWSPDGQKIAFASNRSCVTHCDGLDIYTINADGTGMSGLTSDGFRAVNADPAWSPDGQTIAFDRNVQYPDLSAYEIDTIKPDGSGRATVTAGVDPNWSPDGRKLAFAATLAHDGPFDVYVANADGTGRINLTNSPASEDQPAWSPDGTKLAFVTDRDGNDEIYSMNADGTGATNLTMNSAPDLTPDWQPIPNRPPDCSQVTASPSVLTKHNRSFVPVTLDGATDPDGGPVSLSVDGVTQDEPVTGRGDHTSPHAINGGSDEVRLRAERNPHGNGRVYRIAFTASDGRGGSCSGTATVSVPRKRGEPAVDSAPPSYDSLVH